MVLGRSWGGKKIHSNMARFQANGVGREEAVNSRLEKRKATDLQRDERLWLRPVVREIFGMAKQHQQRIELQGGL